MIIKIIWKNDISNNLFNRVKNSIEELGLSDFITLNKVLNDVSLEKELWIKEFPALIIEEESIDFKDVIFEWIIPEEEEIKSMLLSIIWWWEDWWSCWTDDWCGTCTSC